MKNVKSSLDEIEIFLNIFTTTSSSSSLCFFYVDIQVIGALGDSLTCSTGAMASKLMELSMENRGVAWSIGGKIS